MRWAVLLFLAWPGQCQIRDVVKSAEIDKMFGWTGESMQVLAKTNYAVELRVVSGGAGASKTDSNADEFWFMRNGSAKVTIGEAHHDVNAGDVVRVWRGTAYQVSPVAGRVEYTAVRVFPTERKSRIGIGASPQPRPMDEVVTKGQIDRTLAEADKNVLLHSAGALLINHVIYKGAPGPWEVHMTCDDFYFMRRGTARAKLDGTLLNGKEDQPGEIRGTGVDGARDFTIGPGDMVSIPRNTTHHMDPGPQRLGYLLVKVCD
jgi:mannose-6-phosphate isomerase-like protein (cupin superfamily)